MSSIRYPRLTAMALTVFSFSSAIPARATPELAHEHYVRAVELVRQGNPREAKREFARAFELSPHHDVLFNLGKVSIELGELEEARGYFGRFLATGEDGLPVARRGEAERAIRDIDDRLAKRGATEEKQAELAPAPEPALRLPNAAPPRAPPPPRKEPTTHRGEAPLEVDVARERRRMLAYGLGSTGAALVAAGAGVLFWNAARRFDAEAEGAELAKKAPETAIADDAQLARVIDHERAVARNHAELDAVHDFDVVGASALGLGAALLGTGAVLYFTSGTENKFTVRAGARWIQVSKAW